jgi:hypothetical protein
MLNLVIPRLQSRRNQRDVSRRLQNIKISPRKNRLLTRRLAASLKNNLKAGLELAAVLRGGLVERTEIGQIADEFAGL